MRRIALVVLAGVIALFLIPDGRPPTAPAQAAFPGGNGKIAFYTTRLIAHHDLFVMDSDGGNPTHLAHISGSPSGPPAWSRDGRRLAFASAVNAQFDVFVGDFDGTGLTNVTNITNAPGDDTQPVWLSAGNSIAFRRAGGTFVIDVDNPGTTTQLLSDGAAVTSPAWSPDGKSIAHTRLGAPGIHIMDSTGANSRPLTTDPSDGDPDWSPDGSSIVFTRTTGQSQRSIFVMTADGMGTPVNLATEPSGVEPFPTWSPDGTMIAFTHFFDGQLEIYVMGADGSTQRNLTNNQSSDTHPSWQPLQSPVVHSVEFTQAVQEQQSISALQSDLVGDGKPPVPIVAGKPAAMRVYFEEVDQTTHYTVQVSGEFSDTENVTLDPGCRPIDRRRQTGGCTSVDFFFTPPQGQWSVRLVVMDFGGATVLDEEFRLTSVNTAELAVEYLPICVKLTPGAAATCPSGFIDAQAPDLMRKLFPVAEDEFHYDRLPVPSLTLDAPVPDYAGASDLTADLRLLYNLMSIGNLAPDQLAGWLPAGGSPAILGFSDPVWLGSTGRVSWQVDTSASDLLDPQFTLAHEIGHNLGLRHVNLADGCGASDSNTDWPYPDSTIQEVGFDVGQGQAKVETKMDMMSYCSPPGTNVWISPHSYAKLIDGNLQPQAVAAIPASAGPAQFLLIRGDARADGSSGNFGSAYVITSSLPAEPPDPQGNHCLHFTGGDETDYCFTLEFEDHRTHEPADSESFALKVPLPPGTARVALMRGLDELASMEASANGPLVEITSPGNGDNWNGAQTVNWSGSDTDGDALTYAILYSPDGGARWYPLAADSDASELSLDTSDLQPGDNVLFRVLASDGLNTTADTVGPITIAAHLSGDVDCSGGVNSVDALKLSRHVAGLGVAQTEPCPDVGTGDGDIFGDVNCDGKITAVDTLFVLRFVAGMAVNLPQGCRQVGT